MKQVRDDFCAFVKQNPLHPNIDAARRELFICEGSDWFWWYGEPNDSGRDNIFDYIFREHLKNIYLYLGLEVPQYLDTPLLSAISKPSRYPKGEFTPTIDGKENDDESWLNAGCIKIPDGPVLDEDKFFLVNKSFIVNIDRVERFTDKYIELKGIEEPIDLSREKRTAFKQKMLLYLAGQE